MDTSSSDERLKQIRERRDALQLRHGDWPCQTVHNSRERAFQQYVLADIDFLLSLLDSQSDEKFVGPCVGCGHNNYDAERKECKQRWMEGRYSVVCGCPCAKHNSLSNAATRMREACVAHLQATADALDVRQETECPSGTAFNSEAALRRRIATELESLTLTSPAVQMKAHNQHE